jgi:hypothetical protein
MKLSKNSWHAKLYQLYKENNFSRNIETIKQKFK